MKLRWSSKYLKILLCTINLIFVIIGITVVATEGSELKISNDVHPFIEDRFQSTPVCNIIVASIIVIVAVLGFWGAVKESYCLMVTFCLCLALLLFLELAAGFAALFIGYRVHKRTEDTMMKSLQPDNLNGSFETWNRLQSDLFCCGVHRPEDWQEEVLPYSCCSFQKYDRYETLCTLHSTDLYTTGCFPYVERALQVMYGSLAGVAFGLALMKVVGVMLSGILARYINKNKYEHV